MPTRNPVTRFGRGFHGFDNRPLVDLSSSKPNAYGPGVDRVPNGSTRYTIGNTGNPLRPGDAALSPDLVRRYGLKPGDEFTYKGKTYRYADQSWVNKSTPNTNTVEIWYPAGRKPEDQTRNSPSQTVAANRPRELSPNEWQTSPEDRRFLPQPTPEPETLVADNRPATPGRSPSLLTNPNDDWIGAEPSTNVATNRELFSNPDAGTEAVNPTLSGDTLRSLPNARFEAAPAEQFELQRQYATAGEWPDNPTDTSTGNAGDIWGESTVFGSADTTTGRSWDSFMPGGADEESHVFDFEQGDNKPTLIAEGSYPAPEFEPNIEPTGTGEIDLGNETPPDNLLAEQETPPAAEEKYALGHEPVPHSSFISGIDTATRPMPNLLSFGISPFSATRTGSTEVGGNVGGGLIRYAQGITSYTPGDEPGTSELEQPTSEAEAQGARETADLRARGLLPPSEEEPPTGQAVSPEVRLAQSPSGFNQMTPSQYERATFGGLTPTGYRDKTGSAIWDSRASDLLTMWSQSMAGSPNLAQPDSPNRFYSGHRRLDAFGEPIWVGDARRPKQVSNTRALVGRTINGRPWPAPVPAGGGG